MTENIEQDEHDEAAGEPVSLETVTDEELAEEEAHEAETGAGEPAEAVSPNVEMQEMWDKRWKTHERLSNAYFKKIEDLWGDDAVKLTRWMIGPNSPYGYISEVDVGRLPDDFKQGLETVLGTVREQDYEPDPSAVECSTCRGKGKTKLPTSVAGKETRTCPTCNGAGYLEHGGPSANGATEGLTAPALSLAVAPDIQHGEVDEWGEPRILPDQRPNPNFGKLPQHKVTVEPYGITRLITQQG